jgi:sugar phosphate isomerase/epimerase
VRIGICSFALHRTFAAGKMDFAGYARACRDLGCTSLDPWNAHLVEGSGSDALHAGGNPHAARLGLPSAALIARFRAEAAAVGLPFGCIAVDGAHLIAGDPATDALHAERGLGWIAVAKELGASSVRIDCGGGEDPDEAAFARIAAGYRPLIAAGRAAGVRVLIENHWGPSPHPGHLERILSDSPGLGLLFDTNNWRPGLQREGWDRCARHAEVVHVKTFVFDERGEETTVDLRPAFARLREARFAGIWAVESVPKDGDELGACAKTIALIRRHGAAQAAA